VCLADCPRVQCSSRVRRVLARLRFRSDFVLGCCCSRFADGPSFSSGRSGSRVDGPPGPRGQSVFPGSSLVVLLAFTDCPRLLDGLSAAPGRTVHVASTDRPPLLAGQSASAWQLCSLVRFLSPLFRASACASRNHSEDLRLIHNLVVLAIGV
jgi:hypothetical protein